MQSFALGIDPGERYIGIALVEIGEEQAKPWALLTIDLYGVGANKALRDLLAGRALHRRLRRTLKARRQRLRLIQQVLRTAGASDTDSRIVLGLCRRRGWRADLAAYGSPEKLLNRVEWEKWRDMTENKKQQVRAALAEIQETRPELFRRVRDEAVMRARIKADEFDAQVTAIFDHDDPEAIRIPRHKVTEEIDRLISIHVPSLSEATRLKISQILEKPPKAHGLQNKRVARCAAASGSTDKGCGSGGFERGPAAGGLPACTLKRCRGIDYPALWLGHAILGQLPRSLGEVRGEFLRQLRAVDLPIADPGRDAAFFRRSGYAERKKDFQAVHDCWRQAAKKAELSSGLLDNIDRLLTDANKQIEGKAGYTRVAFCPRHLRQSVLCLTRGENPLAGGGRGRMHSLTWEAIAGKLASYVEKTLLSVLPEGGRVERIVIERAAFDLVSFSKGSRKSSKGKKKSPRYIPNDVRWLGPYGQLRSLAPDADLDTNRLLALELGGLCAICGNPIGSAVDRAHLIPEGDVGGYPYLSVVASHPECNSRMMGKRILKIHKAALQKFEETRNDLKKKHHMLHAWINAKYGILMLLSGEEPDEARVRKYLVKAFTTREATMQSADILADAVKSAVRRAGRGDPSVLKRGAAEIALARWLATASGEESAKDRDPWFIKAAEKEQGDETNHAMDAFIAAALPDPERVGWQNGRPLYGFDREKAKTRLAILASETSWKAALGATWKGNKELKALDVMDLTPRRIWAQAYFRDTQISLSKDGTGEYRISAEEWLVKLKDKASVKSGQVNLKKVVDHINSIRFEPLRDVARKALDEAGDDIYEKVRTAFVTYLKKSTLAGLHGAENSVFVKQPVTVQRLRGLEEWAKDTDINRPVPVTIGVLVQDRWSGGRPIRIKGKLSLFNMESWALVRGNEAAGVRINARRPDGSVAKYALGLDGGLQPLDGAPVLNDSLLKALVEKSRPVMGPFLRTWRQEVSRTLSEAGFVTAELVVLKSGLSIPLRLIGH